MDITVVLSYLGVVVFLTLMPGPDILFVIAQSISQNKKAGIATALGLCSGLIVHISAAALGISAIIYQSAIAFAIVKYAGAIYLLFLSFQSFREKDTNLNGTNNKRLFNYKALYKKGILMNILNPKVSLLFLALLPQFVNESIGNVTGQVFILGMITMLQALVIFVGISILSDKIRYLLDHNSFIAKRINVIKGSILGAIGLQIAFSEK
ncbi:LysE family transporter [Halobacillus sp. A5]|uniref:LysE family translocator n=1 Tax=Halobacillus sp. A5 TaxID=2880263 RepID=UPI0020A6A998|nr:LysE family translocator [Halobacillus sp. A5]